jgi:hypothetical protein
MKLRSIQSLSLSPYCSCRTDRRFATSGAKAVDNAGLQNDNGALAGARRRLTARRQIIFGKRETAATIGYGPWRGAAPLPRLLERASIRIWYGKAL